MSVVEAAVREDRWQAQGKSPRDIQRCLKRTIARQLFRLLERYNQPATEILSIA